MLRPSPAPPARKSSKRLRPDRDHQRQADRPPHRIAPADPILEAEDARRVDAEGGGLVDGRGQGGELRAPGSATVFAIQAWAVSALVIVSMVVKVLEATITSVVAGSQPLQRVVRYARRRRSRRNAARPVVIGRQRQRRHRRAKVRAADADIDDIGDRAALPLQRARRARRGEGRHAAQGARALRHHVAAVDHDRPPSQVAQRRVQDGAALGLVDLRAARTSRRACRADARRLGQVHQQLARVRVDVGLGIVEEQPVRRGPRRPRRARGRRRTASRMRPSPWSLR